MNNTFIVGVSFVVSLLLSVVLANKAESYRIQDRQSDVGENYVNRSRMPTSGFDAVMADFIWMKTYLRKSAMPPKDASDEEKKTLMERSAEIEFNGYSKVVGLDPTFEEAYELAIRRLMYHRPKDALLLADRAIKFCKKDKDDFSEMAADISGRIMKKHEMARDYYEKLVSGVSLAKGYVARQYLRTLVRMNNMDPHSQVPDDIAQMISIYHDEIVRLHEKSVEGSQYAMLMAGGAGGTKGMALSPVGADSSYLHVFLYEQTKSFMTQLRNEEFRQSLKPEKIQKVQEIFNSLKPSAHLCNNCYSQTLSAGEQYCSNCGIKHEVFGTCSYASCKDKHIVLKGSFCHHCGRKPEAKTDL